MAIYADTLKIFQSTDVTIVIRDVLDADGKTVDWREARIAWGLTNREGQGDLLLLKRLGEGVALSKDGSGFAILLSDAETQSLATGKYYHEIKAQSPAGQDIQVLAPSLINIVASALTADTTYSFALATEYRNPSREFTGQLSEVWRDESSLPGPKILSFQIVVPKDSNFEAGDIVEAEIITDIDIDKIEIQGVGAGVLQLIDVFDEELAYQILERIRALNSSLLELDEDLDELEGNK